MSKLNICIDIDGTITDPYHFIPYLNEIYNKNITPEQCTTYNWDELYESDMKSTLEKLHGSHIHCYGEAEVVEGAKDIIGELYQEHNLYFVTARSEILKEITCEWLNTKGLSNIDVYLLGSDYKVNKAKELECNIFIEDNPTNAMELALVGMKVLLINTNYNKCVEHENITRVNGWCGIKKYIEEYK